MNEIIFLVDETPEGVIRHARSVNPFLPRRTTWKAFTSMCAMRCNVILSRIRRQRLSASTS